MQLLKRSGQRLLGNLAKVAEAFVSASQSADTSGSVHGHGQRARTSSSGPGVEDSAHGATAVAEAAGTSGGAAAAGAGGADSAFLTLGLPFERFLYSCALPMLSFDEWRLVLAALNEQDVFREGKVTLRDLKITLTAAKPEVVRGRPLPKPPSAEAGAQANGGGAAAAAGGQAAAAAAGGSAGGGSAGGTPAANHHHPVPDPRPAWERREAEEDAAARAAVEVMLRASQKHPRRAAQEHGGEGAEHDEAGAEEKCTVM